ncbi:PAS domain S-box protein [Vacuolonema iberomarrocanum]|uniref:PAS domain S-box protein n=1 Tax=Vacuolonema iberomarrocanum TaxID=3454632 RepID=UPI0019DCB9C0|nr:PAS domain S-box protein [filamentous cyanobacterium LEGE 07170]
MIQSIDQVLLASLDLVFVQDREGRFTYLNEITARAFGSSRDQLLGQALSSTALPPEVIQQLSADHREIFASGHPTIGEIRLSRFYQNTVKDYEYTFSPINSSHGVIEAAVFIAKDVTQRKQAEVALQASEAKYRTLFEAASDIILILDASSYRILDANWAAARKLGYTRQDLLQRSIHDIEATPDAERWQNLIRRMEIDADVMYEDSYRRKNGTAFPVEISAKLIEYEEKLCIQSFVRDITERKASEATLWEQQQQIESIATNVPGAIYRAILHKDGQISLPYISEGERQISGYSPQQVMNDPYLLCQKLHPEDRQWYEEHRREHSRTLNPWDLEYRVVNRYGDVLWVKNIAHFYRDAQGDVVVDGVTLDVSDRKTLEELVQRSEKSLTQLLDDLDFSIGRFRLYPNDEVATDFISAGCERVFGYTAEEMTQVSAIWVQRILPEDWVTIVKPFHQRVCDTGIGSTVFRFRHKSGQIRHIAIKAIAYHDDIDGCWVITALETVARLETVAKLHTNDRI